LVINTSNLKKAKEIQNNLGASRQILRKGEAEEWEVMAQVTFL